ncbi:MAG TPA: efflux RND transporter permease subunit [Pirellulales bacterium]|nr:efflux RND transporter permease subunit [Pirellulales bacterium]
MIERIIEASIRNRFLVLVVGAALTLAGIYAVYHTPVDAIPDLSENQVIVFTDWMGRSPREVEDQVTYPLSLKLKGLAGIRAVRSSSEFNFSMITLIFEEGIDFYFARQRVTEKLTQAATFLPPGVVPYMAPDATALGQIFWYTVETSRSNPVSSAQLWGLNKFYVAPQLNAAAGVADVAVVGGTPLEYQIDVRPEDLRAYGITLGELYAAVSKSNMPAGGGVVQKGRAEYIVRGVGWIKDKQDIENTVIKEVNRVPIYVKTIAGVQLGTQFRRAVYEKNGDELTGGAVLMRHGENPLEVTEGVKQKIQEIQPGLPEGVHIVPAYDRTRLIHGAIHTLRDVMWHEIVIASIAILLILSHVRSVFVICITLPLAVLFSFLSMWVLRVVGIIDIQANIMSLAGITISVGILVDQAIVMVENATHALKEHFGDRKVTGDIRELVIPACRTVGRPVFFSVMIMLISFVPVFMLTGREGKYFHPLAFTKSFALLGVALISITLVPALIPTFIKGRLRSEEENWIVRSFINIYKPLLAWALPRRNLVMWMFAALLILAAGMFPLQAIIGQGASEIAWRRTFLGVFAIVTSLTVIATRGVHWQAISLASLILLGLASYKFPKIGVAFMPALDEGTTLDMPITVPRASVTQSSDDLKARDALLRGFPEVESVIGKAGRADTPTDPAPLDMVETFVNFRPKDLWPKRVLKFKDAQRQVATVLKALQANGYVRPIDASDRESLINDAAQKALERFDETLRELALRRYEEFNVELEDALTRFAVSEIVRRLDDGGTLNWATSGEKAEATETLSQAFSPEYGRWLAMNPSLEDVSQLLRDVASDLKQRGLLSNVVEALELREHFLQRLSNEFGEALGGQPKTFAGGVLKAVNEERTRQWIQRVQQINWELFDEGTGDFCWYALEEVVKAAKNDGHLQGAPHAREADEFATAAFDAQLGKPFRAEALVPFESLREELEADFRNRLFLWPRQTGPKGDLVDDEMGRVLQVPGWSNIFTQPIINRIEMLSTGVRTDIGVKIFGPDLDTIDRVCKEVEAVLKPLNGARDVIAAPIMGKGYLQIDINREQAARYGISVEDIENEIEVALAGRAITYTVENRERFPVRVRYARAQREDEESIRRLLVSPGNMTGAEASEGNMGKQATADSSMTTTARRTGHAASPVHAARGRPLIPLSAVADVRVVEGPAMIKSENGQLLNYVTLNVRGRDIVGFVDEAQRMVAAKIKLPEGAHIEWSGEFEHQVRAAKTLRFVFPVVIVLIFVILYLTYNDLMDAVLMMLAVPEALAGGAFFMYLFPKIMQGWDAPPMDFSVAVWVGFIACFGMATETGIIMLVYLREAIEKRGGLENIASLAELRQAVIEGAVHRLRPKLLTEGVAIIAIFPMVFAKGVGGEILAPMALPVLGGLLISDEVVDLFLPVRFYWVRRNRWLKLQEQKPRNAHESTLSKSRTGAAADIASQLSD